MPAERPPISFDLTSQPWLPVQGLNGLEAELSLLEVFEQAEDLRRLIGDVPTQEFALLRLLLAILHDAIDGPADIEEWQELWESGLPINDIADYLGLTFETVSRVLRVLKDRQIIRVPSIDQIEVLDIDALRHLID